MNYNNPLSQETERASIGLDSVLKELRNSMVVALPWLNGFAFIRAYKNTIDNDSGILESIPQVYMGNGEYYDCRINDNLIAHSFFYTDNSEVVNYSSLKRGNFLSTRDVSLILSVDLGKLKTDYSGDYIYTESIKKELINVLKKSSSVQSIKHYIDSPIEEVYRGFTITNNKQYDKFPFASIRIDFTAQYKYDQICS